MSLEQLIYAQIAERLSVSTEAARAIVKRHRLPRSRSNDGKTLAAIVFRRDQAQAPTRAVTARAPIDH
jgi:2,3-bisphosphoglycerate-independent phosphoglycerate mutase